MECHHWDAFSSSFASAGLYAIDLSLDSYNYESSYCQYLLLHGCTATTMPNCPYMSFNLYQSHLSVNLRKEEKTCYYKVCHHSHECHATQALMQWLHLWRRDNASPCPKLTHLQMVWLLRRYVLSVYIVRDLNDVHFSHTSAQLYAFVSQYWSGQKKCI